MRVFISATVKGPFTLEDGQTVYTIDAKWQDVNGTPQNFRRAYSQVKDLSNPGQYLVNDYPQMVTDFAAWPDGNGNYPDSAAYAAAAHWTT